MTGPDELAVAVIACPVVVMRLAGLPADTLDCGSATAAALERLREAQAASDARAAAACDMLAAALPRLHGVERHAANVALTLKRDLHNGRRPRPQDIERVRGFLEPGEQEALEDALVSGAEVERCLNDYAASHARDLDLGFTQALDALAEPGIAAALSNTVPDLAARVRQARDAPARMSRKALANAQASAMRHAARISLKTSPMSVYGIVALGGWGPPRQDAPNETVAIEGQVTVIARPNYGPLGHIVETVISNADLLSDEAPLRLNRSLHSNGKELRWRKIENSPAGWRVRHMRTTLSKSDSPALRLVAKMATDGGDEPTMGDLVARIRAAVPTHSEKQVRNLVSAALANQIVVCGSTYGQPPMAAAREAVAHLRSPLGPEMAVALDQLETAAWARDSSGAAQGLLQLATAAGIALDPSDIRPPLFEDALIPGRVFEFDEKQRDTLTRDISASIALATALQPGTYLERSRKHLVRTFTEAHGHGGRLGDPSTFLSAYAEELERAASKGDEAARILPHDTGAQAAVGALLAQERDGAIEMTAEEALKLAPDRPARPRLTSQMCFLQPYLAASGDVRYAMNRSYAGAASTFSRFVPDAEWPIKPLRDYLDEISEPGGAVEILGWFGFNACDHPDIVERKVAISPIDAPGGATENITDFGLRHRPEWDDLVFFDKSGRDVSLTFTSVLSVTLMPRMHSIARLIGTHTESFTEAWAPVLQFIVPGEDGIKRCPRVTIGSVTAVRRQIVAPPHALPDARLSHADYHAAINQQMDREGMPRWLYVTKSQLRPEPGTRGQPKPFPVDRRNPAMTATLQKDLAQPAGDISFVEALPPPEDSRFRRGGRPVMVEHGIEIALKRERP